MLRHVAPAGDVEVDPPADQARREAPQRDLLNELPVPADGLPALGRDHDRGEHGEHVHQPVGVHEQGADGEAA